MHLLSFVESQVRGMSESLPVTLNESLYSLSKSVKITNIKFQIVQRQLFCNIRHNLEYHIKIQGCINAHTIFYTVKYLGVTCKLRLTILAPISFIYDGEYEVRAMMENTRSLL